MKSPNSTFPCYGVCVPDATQMRLAYFPFIFVSYPCDPIFNWLWLSKLFWNHDNVIFPATLAVLELYRPDPLIFCCRMTSALLSNDLLYNQLLASMSSKSLLLGANEFHPCCKCGATFGDAKSLTVSSFEFLSKLVHVEILLSVYRP